MLINVCDLVLAKIDSYPAELESKLEDLRQKLMVLFLLYGTFPFKAKNTIFDLEAQQPKKTCRLMAELLNSAFHKAQVDAAWSTFATEQAAWPPLEGALSNFDKDKDVFMLANKFIDLYPSVVLGVRNSAVQFTQRLLGAQLAEMLKPFDLQCQLSDEDTWKVKDIVDLMRRLSALFKSDALVEALRAATDFCAKEASKDIQSRLLQGADDLVVVQAVGNEEVLTFSRVLPSQEGVVLVFSKAEDCDRLVSALTALARNLAQIFPESAVRSSQLVLRTLNSLFETVKLGLTADSPQHKLWHQEKSEVHKFSQVMQLFDCFKTYQDSGECTQAKLEADPALCDY